MLPPKICKMLNTEKETKKTKKDSKPKRRKNHFGIPINDDFDISINDYFGISINEPTESKKKAGIYQIKCTYDPAKNIFRRQISGFKSTYTRIKWDEPAPTIGMTNGSINSQNNVHPGNKLKDGTYSDARVLSVRELTILCGLPEDHFDKYENEIGENFMRLVIDRDWETLF